MVGPAPDRLLAVGPIAVLLVAMAMEAYALRTAVVESNRVRADRSWKEFVRTAKAPELPVILLEDCGAPSAERSRCSASR